MSTEDIDDLLQRARELEAHIGVSDRQARIDELSKKRLDPTFWDNPQSAQLVEKEIAVEKDWVEGWKAIAERMENVETFQLMADEEEEDLSAEIDKEAVALEKLVEGMEFRTILGGPDDNRTAILTIHPGAGGTEAQDWGDMLLRMYTRWAERGGYKPTLLEYQEGEGAGIKSASLRVEGPYAFGYLKGESGVHRLVRMSPFDSSGKRHTSFTSVFVFPEIDDTINIELNPADLELQTFRSGGKGGQNVNKVETGARYIWTGQLSNGKQERVAAESTEERSQLQNRERAMNMLKSRIYSLERDIQEAAKNAQEAGKKKIEWGSQIRSYVFQPYTMVNDHRTETKLTDVQSVMDGEIDEFIKAYLTQAVE